jgi:hypothetical protein
MIRIGVHRWIPKAAIEEFCITDGELRVRVAGEWRFVEPDVYSDFCSSIDLNWPMVRKLVECQKRSLKPCYNNGFATF